MSRGTASRFVFDTTHVNWDGSAFVVKSQINEFAAGPVRGGTRVKFELNDILGLKAGDYLEAKITTSKEVSDKDTNVIEYSSNSNQQAVFRIEGSSTIPVIKFVKVENKE